MAEGALGAGAASSSEGGNKDSQGKKPSASPPSAIEAGGSAAGDSAPRDASLKMRAASLAEAALASFRSASSFFSASTKRVKRFLQSGVCFVPFPAQALQPGVSRNLMIRSKLMYTPLVGGTLGVGGAAPSLSGAKGSSLRGISGSGAPSGTPSASALRAAVAMGKTGSPSSTKSSASGTSRTEAFFPDLKSW